MSLTELERDRIIKDIVNYHIESVTVGSGDELSINEVEELEEQLKDCSDENLASWWHGGTGEWVASRDLDADEQFEQLKESGDIDYGYVAYKYSQPYA